MWLSLLGAGIQGAWAWTWDGATIQEPGSQGELPASCSVVVCCHNEAHRMARLAEHLRPALDHAEGLGMVVTVVAVNHGSTDDTQRELEHVAGLDARWHVVSVPRTQASKKEALNAAMDAATGDVRVMTDADCVPSDVSWLSHMSRGANAMWDVCVGISLPVEPSHGRLGWLARCQRLEARRLAQRATGAVDAGRPYLAFGRNMAVTSPCGHAWADLMATCTCPLETTICGFKKPRDEAPASLFTPFEMPKPRPNGPPHGVDGGDKKHGISRPVRRIPGRSKHGCWFQDWGGRFWARGLSTIPRGHPSPLRGSHC